MLALVGILLYFNPCHHQTDRIKIFVTHYSYCGDITGSGSLVCLILTPDMANRFSRAGRAQERVLQRQEHGATLVGMKTAKPCDLEVKKCVI